MNSVRLPRAMHDDPMASDLPAPEGAAGAAPTVRWLAELCGVATPGVPLPRLFTELLGETENAGKVRRYLAWWIRHPDEGSFFHTISKPISSLSDEALIEILRQRQYDGLCYLSDGEIVGHVFFQKHRTEMCAFSAAVCPESRGGRLWAVISLDFVAHAARVPGMLRASVGTGRNTVARLLIRLLTRHAPALGWRTTRDGWIEFPNGDRTGSGGGVRRPGNS